MDTYINEGQAIIGMHEKGFTEDFQMSGNDLYWVREHAIIRINAFYIAECHLICKPGKNQSNKMILGVYLPSEHIGGIIVKRLGRYANKIPPVIRKKLGELIEHIRPFDADYGKADANIWVSLSGDLEFLKELRNLRFWKDELLWSHLN